ncbi:hypothetical protein QTG54_007705 [Skeletonema marinoi]|uniref:Uncharacterized protein n=1 Tax=Skeletonema marinoi TaxID=267567 RepID=A0AAD8Y832_9STRA|nr:hypothetical protein QTG54_007705 [Skeletonema marinoi]
MTLTAYRFTAALSSQPSSCCSIPSFISALPDSIMSSKRSGSSDKSSAKKKAKQQQSLTGFFTSAKAKADDDAAEDTASSFIYKIFCDLDGVLVDFDSGVKSLFNGRSPDQLPVGTMWGRISSTPDFYANLPWTSDGQTLWNELVQLPSPPDILTGVPRNHQSRAEKFAWCQRELISSVAPGRLDNVDTKSSTTTTTVASLKLNHVDMAGKKSTHEAVSGRKRKGHINVITCWSRNKHCESKKNHVLIDDRLALREAWEENGGIFVHHTSAERTLEVLRERGILGCSDGDD